MAAKPIDMSKLRKVLSLQGKKFSTVVMVKKSTLFLKTVRF